jgi:MarR-like DNA-binding transcriptional regulator SgrR of sgrS sRNA
MPTADALFDETLSYLSAVDVVSTRATDAAQLLMLGEADLAVVIGHDAARLSSAQRPFEMLRAPGWDRLYFLWSDPTFRWTADPNFRRWLGGVIDRQQLGALLFDGYASASWRLLQSGEGPAWSDPVRAPFAATSHPVLRLAYDDSDLAARAIASRLKATLATERVEVQLEADSSGRRDLHLVGFEIKAEDGPDSLARLIQRLDSAADVTAAARIYLDQGAVQLAEDALLLEANAIPLIRLQAWFGMDPRLVDVRPGFVGDVGLKGAWWQR